MTPTPMTFMLNLLDLQKAIDRVFENGLITLWLLDDL
jgi:hypothetical protein